MMSDSRFQCEARYCLALRARDKNAADAYLQLVLAQRGKEAYDKLRNTCAEQWGKGNRGNYGDWRK